MSSHISNVAGMPTASIAESTPRPPVIFMTFSAASPSLLLTVAVAATVVYDNQAIVEREAA
jgi:hypothetical protein